SLDLTRALAGGQLQTFFRAPGPASLPYVMAALKLAATAAALGATVGEWLGTAGVGYLLFSAMVNFQVELLWATMVIATAVALAGYLLFVSFERVFLGWTPAARGPQ